jgi:hypothetical protein
MKKGLIFIDVTGENDSSTSRDCTADVEVGKQYTVTPIFNTDNKYAQIGVGSETEIFR